LLENKVAAASVTSGQLQSYYDAFLLRLSQTDAPPGLPSETSAQPICVVYVTPDKNVGALEFASLALEQGRADKKVHISWKDLIDELLPLSGSANDWESRFFDDGLERVRNVLDAASQGKLPPSDVRSALQALLIELTRRLQGSQDFAGLSFSRWSDRVKEQLFAAGPARAAYVGLYMSVTGSMFPTAQTIRAVGEISFDAASKLRARLHGTVEATSRYEWSRLLGVPSETIHIDSDKQILAWRFALPEMQTEEFLLEMEQRWAAFVRAFRSILVETEARA